MKRSIILVVLIMLSMAWSLFPDCSAQSRRKVRGTPMYFEVVEGDTVFFDTIDPIWVFPRGRRMKNKDWRKEYKLVYNFNKVYPYALVGRSMMHQVDSTIEHDHLSRSEREKYIHAVEKELFDLFTQDLKNMTISQGMILMRLVDRECGLSPYMILQTYVSGFAANFWQLVAKMFSQDLKGRYDPNGKDAKLEELVKIWDSGNWESFYYSIFWEAPKKTVLPAEELKSRVIKKENRKKQ